ncbi:mitochondrial sodium/calcium exchanger protein-like [Drosophila innubila]|uniref:mitochondrial sodium/calcium exchanger protein-like n=1 Tax=Drosophila innubila TaxID=198719 RepID=UPI00148D5DBC|nr:mitochondrial sodium/calcium exchanger protein-like [Drosophila innubila]
MVTTIQCFVPALQTISKSLNLNEYVAGITILTFGNNAPVLINTFFGQYSTARHVYTDSMSVNLFESVLTSAAIMWVTPFAIDGTFFLRDVGFVLLYISYVDFIFKLSGGEINILRAASMVSVYIIYITVIILDEYLQYRKNKEKGKLTRDSKISGFDTQVLPIVSDHIRGALDIAETYQSANKRLLSQFFEAFDILDRQNYNSKWTIFKLWALVKVPPMIFLRLSIPQVNVHESSYKWSKLLLSIQVTLTPILLIFFYTFESHLKFFIWTGIAFFVFIPFTIMTFAYTRTDSVPKWSRYIAILTIFSSVTVIYFVGKELVFCLESLGIILNRSHTFIGCTFYTWGNGLSDFLANISLAKQGYPRMAFSACFGVCIFSTFASICIPILYQAINSKSGVVKLTEGTIGETASIILIISLIILILYGITTNFMLRRTGAIIGISLYLLFLTFSISSEFEITHAFGTDHSLDRSHYNEQYGAN